MTMKTFGFLLLCSVSTLAGAQPCFDVAFHQQLCRADSLWEAGSYAQALPFYQAIENDSSFYPEAYYYYANAHWQMGDTTASLEVLQRGLSKSLTFQDTSLLGQDAMMAYFVEHGPEKGVVQLFENYQTYRRRSRDTYGRYRAIGDTLRALRKIDQSVRGTPLGGPMDEAEQEQYLINMWATDSMLQRRLDLLIDTLGGWPGIDEVGISGSSGAWMILQHSRFTEPRIISEYRMAMEAAYQGNIQISQMKIMMDRCMLHDGYPQIFGTQWRKRSGENFATLSELEYSNLLPYLEKYYDRFDPLQFWERVARSLAPEATDISLTPNPLNQRPSHSKGQ